MLVSQRRAVALDAVLGIVVLAAVVGFFAAGIGHRQGEPSLGAVLVALAPAFVAIVVHRLWPRAALLLVTAGMVWQAAVSGDWDPLLVIVEGGIGYLMALRTPRRRSWPLACGCGLALFLAYGVRNPLWSAGSLPVLAFFGMVIALGDATRSRRAYLTAVEQRARNAELTREEEAQRRVMDERLRIARELHDVVAHHIAVINMQAGGASRIIDYQPDQARAAMNQVGLACDTVLQELGSIVGVLRRSGEPDPGTEPTRGLARVPELVESVRLAGLLVEYRQDGDERALPAVADLAAYRIVQESLTNARKYGTGTARVIVAYTDRGVSVEVLNPVAARRSSGSGYGIIGMRERASAAGGTLRTGLEQGVRFRVYAQLPAPVRDRT